MNPKEGADVRAIDFRLHLGASLFGPSLDPDAGVAQMDALGIERAVICPVKPRAYHLGPENDRVAAWARARPDRFVPFARVDPWQGEEAVREAARAFDTLGARGLYLDPWEELFPVNGASVDPLARLCAERGLPFMVAGGHVRVSTAGQIGDLAARHPTLRIVATSAGQINVSGAALHEAEVLLREHPNVWMETSGIYRQDFIEEMAAAIGPGRIVFGSGAPRYDQDHELRRVAWSHLDPAAKRAILRGNAEALLGVCRGKRPVGRFPHKLH